MRYNALAAGGGRDIDIATLRAMAEIESGGGQRRADAPPIGNHLARQAPQEAPMMMLPTSSFPSSVVDPRRLQPSKFQNTAGRIGDTLAVLGGRKPTFGPWAEERRYKNALASYASAPEDPGRFQNFLAEGGDTAANMAFKFRDDRREGLKSTQDLDAGRMKMMRDANRGAIEMLSGVKDQASWEEALERADGLYGQFGANVRDHLPEVFPGPDGLRDILMQAMDVDKRLAAMDRRDRLEWDMDDDRLDNERADRNVSSLVEKRSQPPAPRRGPAPRAVTTSSVVGPILQKVARGEELTAGEREIYTRYQEGAGGRGGGRRGVPAPAPKSAGYKIGQTATHPVTGAKVVWNGAGFVPVRK